MCIAYLWQVQEDRGYVIRKKDLRDVLKEARAGFWKNWYSVSQMSWPKREREKKKECGANVRSLVRGTQSQNQKTRSGVGMGGYTRNGLSDHFLVLCG